jgi:preprotein translocase subunit SecG
MSTLVTVLQVIACFLIIAFVLLQPSKGDATVLGGSSQSVFGSTGGTTILFRGTMWLAAFVMASSLFMAWYRANDSRKSIIDASSVVAEPIAPAVPPVAPVSPSK